MNVNWGARNIKKIVGKTLIILLTVLLLTEEYVLAAGQLANWKSALIPDFTAPREGCALFIDLDALRMKVYADGKVYKTYPISGGKASSPSPEGVWKVVNKTSAGGKFGGSWIGLNVPWGNYGIHGTLSPWVVGAHNVSNGCIRMRDEDVLEVKRLVSIGSLVYIRQNSRGFRAMKNGMVGSDVFSVQKMLEAQGYYPGPLDGKFGGGLEEAVRMFQEHNRMAADGVVGFHTYMRIYELTE